MKAAVFGAFHGETLPPEVERLQRPEELRRAYWDLLALTPSGCRQLSEQGEVLGVCRTLLLPGGQGKLAARLPARQVISCGLSAKDSLTFSSLEKNGAVGCVQRTLVRPDGGNVEPQELPLGQQSGTPEEQLIGWGLRLLL